MTVAISETLGTTLKVSLINLKNGCPVCWENGQKCRDIGSIWFLDLWEPGRWIMNTQLHKLTRFIVEKWKIENGHTDVPLDQRLRWQTSCSWVAKVEGEKVIFLHFFLETHLKHMSHESYSLRFWCFFPVWTFGCQQPPISYLRSSRDSACSTGICRCAMDSMRRNWI